MADYVSDSPELRLHLRNLLHDYSLSHYMTNYLTFTEDLASEFIEDLKPIPLTDPYSLVRPVDPYDAFSQLHGMGSLEPYDEILQTTNDATIISQKRHGRNPRQTKIRELCGVMTNIDILSVESIDEDRLIPKNVFSIYALMVLRQANPSQMYAFIPPIVKAIKKFRRDVNIADACGTKCRDTKAVVWGEGEGGG
ncbi:hypothetical protein M413DRAFT_12911 [Hebeloma cylindrosporum]|uniref:Uncharacterized protein n=1 Tax=Hebeloma cylindrosporum TaxID=76867 RepID=A0A0C3BNG2_HEBCY|nr:hypothetical protein M413DRAFT_12911 [Hebeloma cylindrosporum h7]